MVDIEKAVIARLKTHGQVFEILVDCDKALELREGKDIPIDEVIAAEKVFSDAKKGLLASEAQMQNIFESTDPLVVALRIIKKGDVQVTSEHRASLRDQKRKQILNLIQRNGVDPKTMTPHPMQRLELAFDEAKIKIDDHKSADEQVDGIIKNLRSILPIRIEQVKVSILIPANYAGKSYSIVAAFGKMLKDEWQNDGSWSCLVKIPAGMQAELFDKLNKLTQGNVETKIEGE